MTLEKGVLDEKKLKMSKPILGILEKASSVHH